jgi:hypothetical protein
MTSGAAPVDVRGENTTPAKVPTVGVTSKPAAQATSGSRKVSVSLDRKTRGIVANRSDDTGIAAVAELVIKKAPAATRAEVVEKVRTLYPTVKTSPRRPVVLGIVDAEAALRSE